MIKCIYFLKRKDGMSVEEFHRYWRDVHAPIAAKIPGIRKYVLCYPLSSQYQNKFPLYDGVAELWFDSESALASAMQTEEWKISGADGDAFMQKPATSDAIICGEDFII